MISVELGGEAVYLTQEYAKLTLNDYATVLGV